MRARGLHPLAVVFLLVVAWIGVTVAAAVVAPSLAPDGVPPFVVGVAVGALSYVAMAAVVILVDRYTGGSRSGMPDVFLLTAAGAAGFVLLVAIVLPAVWLSLGMI